MIRKRVELKKGKFKEKKSKYIPIGETDTPDLWEEEEELPPELESIFDSQNIVCLL